MNTTHIENLVFESGGVKGVAYIGAIRALEEQNALQGIEKVAGTSAGSIMAALLAVRFTPDEVHEAVFNMDFKSFEDDKNYREVKKHYGLYAGNTFLQWLKGLFVQKGVHPDITFAGLRQMGGRDLKVYAVDLYLQQLQEFSFDSTPDTIVTEAVRASMSIPLYFRAWQFSNGMPNRNLYVDGGVMLGYPIAAFDGPDSPAAETLGFRLDNTDQVATLNAFGYSDFPEYAKALFASLLKAQDALFAEDLKAQKRTVVINDLGVSGTNFDLTDAEKNALIAEGYQATTAFFEERIIA
ncbi:MAG TPA: hypothetical protein ENJ88_01155 [Phaeodactylibacter sp.]|nr:hypothetical protein [Phaeodactylibacter sp.]